MVEPPGRSTASADTPAALFDAQSTSILLSPSEKLKDGAFVPIRPSHKGELMELPENLSLICRRWRLEAIAELTELLALLMSSDFSQDELADRLEGLHTYYDGMTDRIDRTSFDARIQRPDRPHPELEDTTDPQDLEP
jgi:hypothetical protein